MHPLIVKDVQSQRGNSIVVYGDTNGFSRFARQTVDSPETLRTFTLELYNAFFRYQAETGGTLKLTGDGFLSVHSLEPDTQEQTTNFILESTEKLSQSISALIYLSPYPRPDGFRIRLAAGFVWHLNITLSDPPNCGNTNCERNQLEDWIGYPLILGDRMLELDRHVPLVCCQTVRDFAGDKLFDFQKLPADRRKLKGVFEDDVRDLWSFHKRNEKGEKP